MPPVPINRRNYRMIVALVVLTVAQVLMDRAAQGGFPALAGVNWRLGLAATLILVSVLGARIVPSFTGNWPLVRRTEPLRLEQLQVAIIGAGATGGELAAEVHHTTRDPVSYGRDRIDPDADSRIILIEAHEGRF